MTQAVGEGNDLCGREGVGDPGSGGGGDMGSSPGSLTRSWALEVESC